MNIVMGTNPTKDRGGNARQDGSDDDDDDDDSGSDSDSAGEALTKLLGLPSVDALALSRDEDVSSSCQEQCATINDICAVRTESVIESLIIQHGLRETYQNTSVCVFPTALSIPAVLMHRLADEVVLWSALPPSDPQALPGVQRTYETIPMIDQKKQQSPPGETTTNETVVSRRRRELTRLENLRGHVGWQQLCDDYIRTVVSALLQRRQSLYKTKLNLKPPGGAGFAPHVDTPSLLLPLAELFGGSSPQQSEEDESSPSFITVMIAIDDMTVRNGCLRVAPRPLATTGMANGGPTVAAVVVEPNVNGNPDGDGRAGALLNGDAYVYTDIVCAGGTIVAFDGWVPHRSGVNQSVFGRRAVFLTYHDAAIGDLHDLYYERMQQLRQAFFVQEQQQQVLRRSRPLQQQENVTAASASAVVVAHQTKDQAVNNDDDDDDDEESSSCLDPEQYIDYVALASVPK
jgi:ectoine hydroxylase-related dioxygenase (phytanoyl-CoA dioxygenase family)